MACGLIKCVLEMTKVLQRHLAKDVFGAVACGTYPILAHAKISQFGIVCSFAFLSEILPTVAFGAHCKIL